MDYGKLSFKCKLFHEYTHIAKYYKKIAPIQAPSEKRKKMTSSEK
jgi:hypothetical protein